jgi:acetyl-CoA carboxylase biotin carboxyl carrier protein
MGDFQIDTAAIRELAAILKETGLGEIEYEDTDRRIRIAMPAPAAVVAPAAAALALATAPTADPGGPIDTRLADAITSPMVGTVYLQSGPGEKPFVKVGDQVSAGDILFVIEAMKVMNQIPSTKSGVVKSIEIENGQAVEFGEPLMVIE